MIETFNCPSCGAPLKPDGVAPTMICSFCGDAVVVPPNLRLAPHRPPAATPPIGWPVPATYGPSPITYPPPQARRGRAGCVWLFVFGIGMVLLTVGLPIYLTLQAVGPAINRTTISNGAGPQQEPSATPTPALAQAVLTLAGTSGGPGAFKDSEAAAVDSAGNIYLTDSQPGRILKFDAHGTFVAAWPVGEKYITSLVAGPGGVLYSVTNNAVRVYSAQTGQLQDTLAWKDDDFGVFGLQGVALLPDGTLLATLANTDNLVQIDLHGQEIRRYLHPLKGHAPNDETHLVPSADGQGNIYLLGAHTLYKLAANGTFLNTLAGADQAAGGLDRPHSLMIDPAGRIYISDSAGIAEGIKVFDATGGYLGLIATPSFVDDLVAGNDGQIFAALGEKVIKYHLNSSVLAAATRRLGPRPTLTPAPTSTPLPGVGSTITGGGWVISLGSAVTHPTLDLARRNATLQPDGRYVLVAVDARNQQTRAHSLSGDFHWTLRDKNERVYSVEPTDQIVVLGEYLQQEQRDPLYQPVAPQALTHPLLIFDVPADAPGLQLVIRNAVDGQEFDFALGLP